MTTTNDDRTAYFHLAWRNHREWVITSVLHLSKKDALSRLERELSQSVREQHQTGKIRPCDWGPEKAIKTAGG